MPRKAKPRLTRKKGKAHSHKTVDVDGASSANSTAVEDGAVSSISLTGNAPSQRTEPSQPSSPKRRRTEDSSPHEGTAGCVCFIAGPANRRCPVHEAVEENDESELRQPLYNIPDDDELDTLLANFVIDVANPPEGEVDDYADVAVNDIPARDENERIIRDNARVEDGEILRILQNDPLINRPARMVNYLRAIIRENIEIHYCGRLEETCRFCQAKYFRLEATTRNIYNKCCSNGKVTLPPYQQHTDELRRLFDGQHPLSRQFKTKVIAYNNCFQFASVQANLRDIPGRGPYVYAIQGQVYHHYTDINVNRDQQRYGPVYFLDPEEAARHRVQNAAGLNIDPNLAVLIENELRMVNPYAQQYRHLGRIYAEQRRREIDGEIQIPRVCLEFIAHRPRANRREYDPPEVQEVAAIVEYNENQPPNPQMRVFLTDRDGDFRMLEHESPHSDPLTFPLLFPHGDQGWNMEIPLRNVRGENGRQRVTLCQYYGYRLAFRNWENDERHFNVFRYAGRLNQKFVVSAFLKIEANRINYIRQNQDRLRATEYDGLVDYIHRRGERENLPVGRMVILPSSYIMSPRHQMQRFQDAMAVVSKIGYPSLFITMTCNPKWPEIVENLPPGDEASNHPLLVCRIFKMKLNQLMADLTEGHIMGVCIAHLYVIEFQKRGLPHAHILITLRNEDKFRDPVRIDQLISAELPDAEAEPQLFELVAQHMIHGPCGMYNPTCVCMVNDTCTKNFPKYWYNATTIRDGRINYRRRRNGRTAKIRRNNARYVVDNSFVVPYNPFLLLKYRTHINVEACVNIGTVKYLYKYFFKNTDQITIQVVQQQPGEVPQEGNIAEQRVIRYDEVTSYLTGRYLTPPECSWHILQLDIHGNSHHVERLQLHLPGRQQIVFRDGQEEAAVNVNARTQLLSWFETNRLDENARQLLYTEFPVHYVWKNGQWNRRQRLTKPIVPRLVNVSLRNGELYFLRLLLLHVQGATSFEDLRTVDGVVHDTFREACQHRNLLSEDREWIRSMTEACARDMPNQLRQMFAFILVFGIVDDAPALWRQFRYHLMEDFVRRQRLPEDEAEIAALQRIQFVLTVNGRRLSHFGIDDPPERIEAIEDRVDVVEERREADAMIARLNDEQRVVFDVVMRAVENNDEEQRLFFVTGHAGTGKTFLYNTILTRLIAEEVKVLPVSSTGLAAALLRQGRTVHSRFQFPVPIVENSTSYVGRQSEDARFIRDAKLLLWDEVSMATRLAFDLVDRTLRFLCDVDRPFGGKCVILGGDFKQCLPIVQRGDRAAIVQACVKSSGLWHLFRQFRLQTNMRVRPEEQHFIAWLDQLGNNTLPTLVNRIRPNLIQIPQECVTETLEDLVENIFADLRAGDVPNKAILTPLNDDCHVINQRILDSMQDAAEREYLSVDSVVSDDPEVADIYPLEFLNSLTPSGFPRYRLRLKEGCIVMLLRNLNVRVNLCNGTRLLVRHLGEHYIDAQVIQFDGQLSDQRIFIPRVDFVTNNTSNLPFVLKRRQFPVSVSYCLTINKAQGQSFDAVGIYLPIPVFDHGQLYVAFSRARTVRQVFVCVLNTNQQGRMLPARRHTVYTKNIVYEEVL